MRGLREQGITSQADYDKSAAENKQAIAQTGEMRDAIGRKTIRAPFTGVLGLRQVNLGQYLKPGDPIVSLQSLDPVYVNFSVPQQQVANLRPGAEVHVTAEGIEGGPVTGKITAVNSIVDEATRNIQVQATLANPDGKLRPGMFVEAEVVVGASTPVVALPSSAISYAPYGNSVFIVGPMKGKDGKEYKGAHSSDRSPRGEGGVLTASSRREVVTPSVQARSGAAVSSTKIAIQNPAPKPEDS